jgi:hypothetical protein
MERFLHRDILSELSARRFAWSAGFVLLATCTTLVLKSLHSFGVSASVGLVSAIAMAWVMLGWQGPKAVRA